MAQINEAWRVLSDPGRRAVYDSQLHSTASPRSSAADRSPPFRHASPHSRISTATDGSDWPADAPPAPARFPWQFMVGIASIGIAFVLVSAALTKPGPEPAPDNLMEVGSCVDILDNGDAKEVLCGGTNDGVVADLRPVDSICPIGTELHRDRQGMGNICIRLAGDQPGA